MFVLNLRKISGFFFFHFCHLDFFQVYGINLAFSRWRFAGTEIEGLKQTLISQDIDFLKSRCRLKGRVSAPYLDNLFGSLEYLSFPLVRNIFCCLKLRLVENILRSGRIFPTQNWDSFQAKNPYQFQKYSRNENILQFVWP